jgi:hypothetical protein
MKASYKAVFESRKKVRATLNPDLPNDLSGQ